MLTDNTPVEDHLATLGLLVKREDLSCSAPPFAKTRGVLAHIAARPERVIGVLDTSHSQGGWAVARACAELGKECHLWFPWYKGQEGVPRQQEAARELGATLHRLPAGRSAVLYHGARRQLAALGGGEHYMMPNALKLPEMVSETAEEVRRTWRDTDILDIDTVLISASSGTIAAGVLKGLGSIGWTSLNSTFIIHMGYARSEDQVRRYIWDLAGLSFAEMSTSTAGSARVELVNEGYAYKDVARAGPTPPFPCNSHYDLKAFRWWMAQGRALHKEALLWNIG